MDRAKLNIEIYQNECFTGGCPQSEDVCYMDEEFLNTTG